VADKKPWREQEKSKASIFQTTLTELMLLLVFLLLTISLGAYQIIQDLQKEQKEYEELSKAWTEVRTQHPQAKASDLPEAWSLLTPGNREAVANYQAIKKQIEEMRSKLRSITFCWSEKGKRDNLLKITLKKDGMLIVEKAWPEERSKKADELGAKKLLQRWQNMAAFLAAVKPVVDQKQDCRFRIKVERGDLTDIGKYQNQIDQLSKYLLPIAVMKDADVVAPRNQ